MKNFKNAFTLAESLITMAIIGVIASLTLPALNANIQAHELKTSYNHAYSTVADAERMFSNRYGVTFSKCMSIYGYSCIQDFSNLFLESKEVDKSTNAHGVAGTAVQLYSIYNFKGGSGPQHCDASNRISMNGKMIYSFDDVPSSGKNGPRMCVDINGTKKPNIVGVDIFNFFFLRDGGIVPEGTPHVDNRTYTEMDSNTSTGYAWGAQTQDANGISSCSSSNPIACSYYAARNESPTGNGTYWEDFVGKKQYMKY